MLNRRELLALLGAGIAFCLAPKTARARPASALHNSKHIWTEAWPGPPKQGDEAWYIALHDGNHDMIEWQGPARDLWEAVGKARRICEATTGSPGGQVYCAYVSETF